MNDQSLTLIVKAQDEASAKISELSNQVNKLGGSVSNSAPSFLSMASAVAIGQAALQGLESISRSVIGAIKGVIDAAIEEENNIAQTNAVLESTKSIAGVTSEQITKLAESYARSTPYSDDMVRSAENVLLTFTAVGKDVFPQATEAALNMSTALHKDLQSSVIMIGKALQDPIGGLTALKKAGVNVTEEFKNYIKTLNDTMGPQAAQVAILKQLTTEFGGQATAAGKTFGGQIKILNNDVEMMKETIGSSILTAIMPFIQKLTAWAATDEAQKKVQEIATKVGKMTQKMVEWVMNVAIPWVQEHWPAIKKAIEDAYNAVKSFINFIIDNKDGIVAAIAAIGIAFMLMNPEVMAISIAITGIVELMKWIKGNPIDQKAVNATVNAANQSFKPGGTPLGLSQPTTVKGFASGVTDFEGGLAYVHQGEMLVNMPKGTDVIPKNKVGTNITINFTGDIHNTDNKTLDEIGRRLSRQLELYSMGVSI